jgi:hypothetical protein
MSYQQRADARFEEIHILNTLGGQRILAKAFRCRNQG